MTQPYPPQFGAPAPGPAPQQPYQQPQAYAPQQGGYPPAQAAYPAAPPQYGQQPPAYGYPPQQGAYPMQQPQYAQPQQYQAPAPQYAQPAAPVSIADFYSQPSTGWGPSITPTSKTPDGTAILMVVAQHITEAHFEHKEKYQQPGVLDYFRNGQPKIQMKLPVNVAPGTQYMSQQGLQQVADGRGQYYLANDKDALNAAIAAAGGNPAEPPELGSLIYVVKTHNRPTKSGTQSPVCTYQYWRPGPDAQTVAQQNGIAYPDLNTPKPRPKEPRHAAPEAPAPAPAPQAGPAVQQQAAVPQPVAQPQMPAQPPAGPPPGLPQPPAAQAPSAPVGPPAPGLPPAPAAAGAMPTDPAAQQLLMHLTGRGPAPAAPPAA